MKILSFLGFSFGRQERKDMGELKPPVRSTAYAVKIAWTHQINPLGQLNGTPKTINIK